MDQTLSCGKDFILQNHLYRDFIYAIKRNERKGNFPRAFFMSGTVEFKATVQRERR